jgi:hypothetical protein
MQQDSNEGKLNGACKEKLVHEKNNLINGERGGWNMILDCIHSPIL